MKFKFKFDSLLSVRQHEQEMQRLEYARTLRALYNLQQEKSQISEVLDQYNKNFTINTPDGRFGMIQHYNFIQQSHQKIWELDKAIRRAEDEAEKERLKLVEANKKMKMLEILETKERKDFIVAMERLEQKEMNEVATQLFNRRN